MGFLKRWRERKKAIGEAEIRRREELIEMGRQRRREAEEKLREGWANRPLVPRYDRAPPARRPDGSYNPTVSGRHDDSTDSAVAFAMVMATTSTSSSCDSASSSSSDSSSSSSDSSSSSGSCD
jgi:hypothetical protein